MVSNVIGKNNNIRAVQAESSKFASLSFDQGVQIFINPSSVVYVPEQIGTHLTVFCIDPIVVYYVNCWNAKESFWFQTLNQINKLQKYQHFDS